MKLAELKQAIRGLRPKERLQLAQWLQGEVRGDIEQSNAQLRWPPLFIQGIA